MPDNIVSYTTQPGPGQALHSLLDMHAALHCRSRCSQQGMLYMYLSWQALGASVRRSGARSRACCTFTIFGKLFTASVRRRVACHT